MDYEQNIDFNNNPVENKKKKKRGLMMAILATVLVVTTVLGATAFVFRDELSYRFFPNSYIKSVSQKTSSKISNELDNFYVKTMFFDNLTNLLTNASDTNFIFDAEQLGGFNYINMLNDPVAEKMSYSVFLSNFGFFSMFLSNDDLILSGFDRSVAFDPKNWINQLCDALESATGQDMSELRQYNMDFSYGKLISEDKERAEQLQKEWDVLAKEFNDMPSIKIKTEKVDLNGTTEDCKVVTMTYAKNDVKEWVNNVCDFFFDQMESYGSVEGVEIEDAKETMREGLNDAFEEIDDDFVFRMIEQNGCFVRYEFLNEGDMIAISTIGEDYLLNHIVIDITDDETDEQYKITIQGDHIATTKIDSTITFDDGNYSDSVKIKWDLDKQSDNFTVSYGRLFEIVATLYAGREHSEFALKSINSNGTDIDMGVDFSMSIDKLTNPIERPDAVDIKDFDIISFVSELMEDLGYFY